MSTSLLLLCQDNFPQIFKHKSWKDTATRSVQSDELSCDRNFARMISTLGQLFEGTHLLLAWSGSVNTRDGISLRIDSAALCAW